MSWVSPWVYLPGSDVSSQQQERQLWWQVPGEEWTSHCWDCHSRELLHLQELHQQAPPLRKWKLRRPDSSCATHKHKTLPRAVKVETRPGQTVESKRMRHVLKRSGLLIWNTLSFIHHSSWKSWMIAMWKLKQTSISTEKPLATCLQLQKSQSLGLHQFQIVAIDIAMLCITKLMDFHEALGIPSLKKFDVEVTFAVVGFLNWLLPSKHWCKIICNVCLALFQGASCHLMMKPAPKSNVAGLSWTKRCSESITKISQETHDRN